MKNDPTHLCVIDIKDGELDKWNTHYGLSLKQHWYLCLWLYGGGKEKMKIKRIIRIIRVIFHEIISEIVYYYTGEDYKNEKY